MMSVWCRVLSALMLMAVVGAIIGALFIIFAHLVRQKLNKLLITAFYSTLMLFLVSSGILWAARVAEPHLNHHKMAGGDDDYPE